MNVSRLLDEPQANGARSRWEGNLLILNNIGTHDKVVTHLATRFSQAALTPPIYLQNHSTYIDIDPARLKWIDREGHPDKPPKAGEPVEIVAFNVFAIPVSK